MVYPKLCSPTERYRIFPLDYNYNDEQHRFEEAGKLWKQAAAPYSEHWNKVMNELLSLDFTLDPTFNIYDANRDLQRSAPCRMA
jgi:hypothetical protein